jgi:tetratricopeptide (TPR) repeat protein
MLHGSEWLNLVYNKEMKHFILLNMMAFFLSPVPHRAVAMDMKDNAIWHAQQGQVYVSRQDYGLAIEHLKASLQLNPYSAISALVYNNLGIAYRAQKNYPLALASFQHALRIQPNYEVFYQNLIETYNQAGLLGTVIPSLEAAVRYNPQNDEAYFLLGLAYETSGEPDRAVTCFQQFIRLKPGAGLTHAAEKHVVQRPFQVQ